MGIAVYFLFGGFGNYGDSREDFFYFNYLVWDFLR